MSVSALNSARAAHVSKLKGRLKITSLRLATATARKLELDRELEEQQTRFDRALEELGALALSGPGAD